MSGGGILFSGVLGDSNSLPVCVDIHKSRNIDVMMLATSIWYLVITVISIAHAHSERTRARECAIFLGTGHEIIIMVRGFKKNK